MPSIAELVARCLAAEGVGRLYCAPRAPDGWAATTGPAALEPGDAALAATLADADGALGPAPGAALVDRRLRLSSRPGGTSEVLRLAAADELAGAIARAARAAAGPIPATALLELDLDLRAPAPPDARPRPSARPSPGPLPEIPAARFTQVLAGPGVVRTGCVEGLRAFAAAAGFGVANTWGAKGVFEWQSVHHLGTAGLQALDFELLGFARADLIVATGVDPAEAPEALWHLGAPVVEVRPEHLASLAAAWGRPPARIEAGEFRTRMSRVCMPLQREQKFPLSPGRAIFDLRSALAGDDLLAADAGPAGLWAARAFPTTHPGSVQVPARTAPGFAAAAALAAALRRPARRAVALTCGPLDAPTEAALAWARRADLPFVLEVWSDAPVPGARDVESVDAHEVLLREALAARRPGVLRVAVDSSDTRRLVEVAGDVVAWPDLALT